MDKPLTPRELAELKRLRIGKPLPADAYRNQEAVIRYERERAEMQQRRKKISVHKRNY